jgi:imidazolonepropionase-like amidohydrolase
MQCGGADMASDMALRDAIEAGIVDGPRVLPSAIIFGMTGGHNDMFVPAVFKERWATADGIDECRKAVRTAIRAGSTAPVGRRTLQPSLGGSPGKRLSGSRRGLNVA